MGSGFFLVDRRDFDNTLGGFVLTFGGLCASIRLRFEAFARISFEPAQRFVYGQNRSDR